MVIATVTITMIKMVYMNIYVHDAHWQMLMYATKYTVLDCLHLL